jgi:hypothetical protein
MKKINKRYSLVAILICINVLKIIATEQIADRLIIGKDTFYMKSFPLEVIRDKKKLEEPPFDYGGEYSFPSTGCYRGYVATWKVVDKKLMLIEVEKVDSTNKKLNIIDYFKRNKYQPKIINGYVFADWYSENLKRYESYPDD